MMDNVEEKFIKTLELVKMCGELLKDVDYNKDIHKKEDGSLVTKYDLMLDEKLTKELKEIFNIPIMSEEHKEDLEDTYFVIDPIDGTHNFSRGFECFGIMVALVEKGKTLFSM